MSIPPLILPLLNFIGFFFPSLLYQKTLFIGSPCSDEGRIGISGHCTPLDVFKFIDNEISKISAVFNATLIVWKDFSSFYEKEFMSLINENKYFHLISFPGTEVKLVGTKHSDYLSNLKSSRRNKLNKKLKLAYKAPVEVQIVQDPDQASLDEIFNLFWQTYEKGNTNFEKLNIIFFQ